MRLSRLIVHERLQRLGRPGWLGIGAALLALGYALFGLLPDWQRLQQLHDQHELLGSGQPAGTSQSVAAAAEQPLDALHRRLPAQLEATTAIDHIYALARQQSLALDSGEYSLGIDPKTQLARYQIVLPLRGSYPQLRRFLHALLVEMPGLVLEDVDVQRRDIAETELTGRLRLTLYLSRQS